MEVGKLIQSVTKEKAHMVVSVKPFATSFNRALKLRGWWVVFGGRHR